MSPSARFVADVPSYDVDLTQPERLRWAAVIEKERERARALVAEAGAYFSVFLKPIGWAFSRLYRRYGGQ